MINVVTFWLVFVAVAIATAMWLSIKISDAYNKIAETVNERD